MTFTVLPRPGRPRNIRRVLVTCWDCSHQVEVDYGPMETVGDVFTHAYRARMVPVMDELNERVLVFCDWGCAAHNRNAEGEYRRLAPEVSSRAGQIISSVYLLAGES